MEKLKRSRALAAFLALVMIVGMLPMSVFTTVFATGIDSYSVRLTDGENVLDLDGVDVTLTNKEDNSSTSTVQTVDGVAVFENFVEDGVAYTVCVADVFGYETVADSDITAAVDHTSADIVLTALTQVSVSGVVTDENDAPYKGASVEVSGYVTAKTETDADGKYEFKTYAGKENTILISATEKKYSTISCTATYNTDTTDANYRFSVKTFSITTSAGEHGSFTISADKDGSILASGNDVLYGDNRYITIAADEGYRIREIVLDEQPIDAVKDKTKHIVELEAIDSNHSITVSFYATYTVSFDVSTNGNVEYNTSESAPGGTVTNVTVEENGSVNFKAIANSENGYHVEKVTIGDTVALENGNNDTTEFSGSVSSGEINTTVKVEVLFAINEYKVTVAAVEHGKAVISDGNSSSESELTIKHGEEVYIQINPAEHYDLSKLEVGSSAIKLIETINGYETLGVKITSDVTVNVALVKKDAANPDSYILKLPEANNTVNGVTYVADGTSVTFVPNGEYKRVQVNYTTQNGRKMWKKGSTKEPVEIVLGKDGVEKIDSVAASKDVSWGKWDEATDLNITYDAEEPTISAIKNSGKWFASETEYSFTVADTKSGVKEVKYAATNDINAAAIINAVDGRYSFTVSSEFNGDYYIWVTDYCGNMLDDPNDPNDPTVADVKIDLTAPAITGFQFNIVQNDQPAITKVLNFLTFGIFANDQVEITVTASDKNSSGDNDGSGVKTITLFLDNSAIGETKIVNNQATFTVPTEELSVNYFYSANISAKATDMVGNTTEEFVSPTDTNKDIKSNSLTIENVKPTATITAKENPAFTTAESRRWYNDDVSFEVSASDADSGIREVSITINGATVVKDVLTDKDIQETTKDYEVVTNAKILVLDEDNQFVKVKNEDGSYKRVERADDGSYTVVATVTDNAGNVFTTDKYVIYKDTDAPYISGFDFEPEKFVDASEDVEYNKKGELVVTADYGFYFKADTKVTITAKDDKDEAPSAGIKYIAVYLKDAVGEELYTFDADGELVDLDKDENATKLLVDENNQITITIPANFKGQIYAKATDNVGNVAEKFVNPNGVILETQEEHDKYGHISFKKDKTSYTANDGTELYAENVDVTITVEDTYSGIREIEWSVVAPYGENNEQSGTVNVDNGGNLAYSKEVPQSEKNWESKVTERNLVTKMSKTIRVSNNSNDIVVKVKMTDRAGNTSTDSIKFSIDQTAPTINISYGADEIHDTQYTDYFSTKRTATITVTERNFRASDIVFAITNTDGVIPTAKLKSEAAWTTIEDKESPDKTIHVATVSYEADGDYTFDISYKDNAENPANKVATHRFTIDRTMPEVTVVYDNNSAMNGNYYKVDRIATITIKEHNFDSSRVNVIGTATDDGAESTFPAISAWKDNGNDTHTATIAYTADSKYSFDIEFRDKANNSIADYTPEEFYVDKTAPDLSITGVADKSANNGEIAPVITYSDTNFDKAAVTITLSGINNGKNLKYTGSYADIKNGQTYTYANFEKVQSVDDIYTLTAKLTDMAGNETEATITFSANRFGSVYDLSGLEHILSKYLQTEEDIVFTETNVDTLEREGIKIKLTKNGTPSDLVEGTDYTVDVSGGNGEWSVYTYTLKKALFADDGRYSIAIYSKDAAGNVNENIDEVKAAEISFGMDKTNPVIVPIDLESGVQYAVDMKTASVEIKDNLVLESVKIYLNGKEVDYTVDGEIYTFDIPKSNSKQDVKIVATDAAGNEEPVEITGFLVNANLFVRWYNNTPLFIGSIIGVVVLVPSVAGTLVFGKKKKVAKKV